MILSLNKYNPSFTNSEAELDLELDVKNIGQDKRESVRNLYDSGISEEMIAEQVDLNIATVKSLIKLSQPVQNSSLPLSIV